MGARWHSRSAGLVAATLAAAICVAACANAAIGPSAVSSAVTSLAASAGSSGRQSIAPSTASSRAPTPAPSDGSSAGQTRVDALGVEQVWVPAGTFEMGTDAAAIAELTAAGPPTWVDAAYYRSSPAADPTGPATGTKKIEKGGWWGSDRFVARSAYRHYEDPPAYNDRHIGFRVASQ